MNLTLTNYLDASFSQCGDTEVQGVTAVLNNNAAWKYGFGQLRPGWEAPSQKYSSIFTHKRGTTERALMNLAKIDANPFDDAALEYTNLHAGCPVIDAFRQRTPLPHSGD